MLKSLFFLRSLLLVVSVQLLCSCSENNNPFQVRKGACERYLKNGFLIDKEVQDCATNKSVFAKGAKAEAKDAMKKWYPLLVAAANKVNKHAESYNKSEYIEIPLGKDIPYLSDEDYKDEWKYIIPLEDALLSEPSNFVSGECSVGSNFWSISGSSPKHVGDPIDLSILGIPPFALLDLDLCLFMESPCSAILYTDMMQLNGFTEVVVMAMEFNLPDPEVAYKALYEREMTFWGQEH